MLIHLFRYSVNYYGDNFVRASGNVKEVANAQCE